MTNKKRLLSGIQPSGRQHVGNYFGAMKQFVDMQEEYDPFIFVANYHALTTVQDKKQLSEDTYNLVLDYLAVGLDPERTTLYLQSDVPEVTELTWVFNTIITVPFLSRAHAYKDKIAQGIEASVGLFDYPVLMAADILMVDPDIVPVGEDQKQHVEIARDIGEKFNRAFGDTFNIPKALIREEVAVVPGIDGRKMSKSYGNTIPLFATDEEIEKAVMSIPTDSKGVDEPKNPDDDLVFTFHQLFSTHEINEIREGYEKGGLGYGDSKKKLVKNISSFIGPMRERREEIAKDKDAVVQILENGGDKVRSIAKAKMMEVREKTGLEI